jgi:choice-of-anchor A domain-containing protein
MRLRVVSVGLLLLLCAGRVGATPIDAFSLLASFNTLVLGDLSVTSETQGPLYVGGNLTTKGTTVNSSRLPDGVVGPVRGSLVVGGDLFGGDIMVEAGDARIGGEINGTLLMNGGGSVATGVTDIPTDAVAQAMLGLSAQLAGLEESEGSGADVSDFNKSSIASGIAGADGISIVHAPLPLFGGGTFLGVTGIDVATIVNVAGDDIRITTNFNTTQPNVLFNFHGATRLSVESTFHYSILAPLADMLLGGGGVKGTVVAGSLVQNAEIRPPLFQPPSTIPLPAPALLLVAGLASLAAAGRRRR